MEFAHAWPITGALAGFIAIVALSGAAPIVATTAIVVIYLLGFWIGARLTRELRRRSRTLTASTVFIAGELTEFGDVQLLKDTRARLGDLEMRRVSGDIDPIHYETEWADVYSSIPSEPLLALNP